MDEKTAPITQKLNISGSISKILIGALAVALLAGAGTGYLLALTESQKASGGKVIGSKTPTSAEEDLKTFDTTEEGTLKKKPEPKDPTEYTEGTHYLIRDDHPTPVALTSSVIDLSKYEGKKVKVHGQTLGALKEGWLMDVGRIDEIK